MAIERKESFVKESRDIHLESLWAVNTVGKNKILVEYKGSDLSNKTIYLRNKDIKEPTFVKKAEEKKVKERKELHNKANTEKPLEGAAKRAYLKKSQEFQNGLKEVKTRKLREELKEWIRDGRWGVPYNTEKQGEKTVTVPVFSEEVKREKEIVKPAVQIPEVKKEERIEPQEKGREEQEKVAEKLKDPSRQILELNEKMYELQQIVNNGVEKLRRTEEFSFGKEVKEAPQEVKPEVKPASKEPVRDDSKTQQVEGQNEKVKPEKSKEEEAFGSFEGPYSLFQIGRKGKSEFICESDGKKPLSEQEKDELSEKVKKMEQKIGPKELGKDNGIAAPIKPKVEFSKKEPESPKEEKKSWLRKKLEGLNDWLNEDPKSKAEKKKQTEEKFNRTEQVIKEMTDDIDKKIEKHAEEHQPLKDKIIQKISKHPAASAAVLSGISGLIYAGVVDSTNLAEVLKTPEVLSPFYFVLKDTASKLGYDIFIEATYGIGSAIGGAILGETMWQTYKGVKSITRRIQSGVNKSNEPGEGEARRMTLDDINLPRK